MKIYLHSAEQISVQAPLSEDWFSAPIVHQEAYVRVQDPDYKGLIAPLKLRRMGKVLRRALVTSLGALRRAGLSQPDAIISGTGAGCIENTEAFLHAMLTEGEEFLQPTGFMQSTHNTISSQIAIELGCHGYNSTYTHKGSSFDSAMLDACLQLSSGTIANALVGGFDEMTPTYQTALSRINYWPAPSESPRGEGKPFAGETSASIVLSVNPSPNALCLIEGIELIYRPTIAQLEGTLVNMLRQNSCTMDDIDVVMTGFSGSRLNSEGYAATGRALWPNKPVAAYKPLFGESYTASALGTYAAAVCLQKGIVPAHLMTGHTDVKARKILLYHCYENKNHSFILLSC